MHLEHESKEKLKKEMQKIVGEYLDLKKYKIFFFGSRVNSKGDEHSDIDIGIEGPKSIPPEIFLNIKEEIDNLPYLYKIDVVDFKRVSKDFRKVALQQIEEIK